MRRQRKQRQHAPDAETAEAGASAAGAAGRNIRRPGGRAEAPPPGSGPKPRRQRTGDRSLRRRKRQEGNARRRHGGSRSFGRGRRERSLPPGRRRPEPSPQARAEARADAEHTTAGRDPSSFNSRPKGFNSRPKATPTPERGRTPKLSRTLFTPSPFLPAAGFRFYAPRHRVSSPFPDGRRGGANRSRGRWRTAGAMPRPGGGTRWPARRQRPSPRTAARR